MKVEIRFKNGAVNGDSLSSSQSQLEMSTTTSQSPPATAVANNRDGNSSAVSTPRSPAGVRSSAMTRTTTPVYSSAKQSSTGIPMPVRKTKTGNVASARSSMQSVTKPTSRISRPNSGAANKHTLEIQFINKNKRLALLKKDLMEKQKPVLDLYQNLVQIKKRLEDLGKVVYLDEVKFYDGDKDKATVDGSGETISPEMITGMQTSIEEIPKTLMDICRNLLSRRNVIVELLENIVKSEVDVSELQDQIETLKSEGAQLQNNLDLVINEHHTKIKEIVNMWHSLLSEKKTISTGEVSVLEEKLKQMEKLREESNNCIQDLQKKLDEKRSGQERYVNELNNTIHGLKDHIKKLEHELEMERKAALDYRNRNNTNAQNSKVLRNKIAELENDKKSSEILTSELNRKLKAVQDQLRHRESQWNKEREELSKSLKHQENLLQKLNADKNSFETRLESAEGERLSLEQTLQKDIEVLSSELKTVKDQLEIVNKEKAEAIEKCSEMEEHIARMGMENKEAMNMLSNAIDWGKADGAINTSEAQEYSQSMIKDIMIREFQDKIKKLEEENQQYKKTLDHIEETKTLPTETEKDVMVKHDMIVRYKTLLVESERKLNEKSQEVAKYIAEIRHLKLRQDHLEELNQKCPLEDLLSMADEAKSKLAELMKKCLESEQTIMQRDNVIDKQNNKINEMENLLRYRENMAGVIKASRDEMILEKESLTRYSQEMRNVLAEMRKESTIKDRLIKEFQEKIELRERQISKLEKELRDMENNLMMTNEKRFKLQETVSAMEKELQSTKAHVKQLADINTRYEIVPDLNSSSPSEGSVKIKITVGGADFQ